MALMGEVGPDLSRELGRMSAALRLTPQAKADILKKVPKGAQTLEDLPEPLRWLYEKAMKQPFGV